MKLEGKVALVTGAARGIGRTLALAFAQEGAAIVAADLLDRGKDPSRSLQGLKREIKAKGGKALTVRCDVTSPVEVHGLVARAMKTFGRIDVLVNNAGIGGDAFVTDFDPDLFERIFAVNMKGPFLLCKYVVPHMMKQRSGSIINICSRNAMRHDPGDLAYGPSKAALERFTLNLAEELREYNIAVNGLAPGLILTDMTRGMSDPRTLRGRVPAPPQVLVPAVLFLAQQSAQTFAAHVVHREDFGSAWP